jgi:hypothetical protein
MDPEIKALLDEIGRQQFLIGAMAAEANQTAAQALAQANSCAVVLAALCAVQGVDPEPISAWLDAPGESKSSHAAVIARALLAAAMRTSGSA